MSAIASGIFSSLAASTLIERRRSVPKTRKRPVLMGMRICSSGLPNGDGLSLGLEHADDGELDAADADVLAEEGFGRLEAHVGGDGGPEDGDALLAFVLRRVNMRPASSLYLRTSR